MLGTGRTDGLQEQQHAPREVLVGVVLKADPACQLLDVHRRSERSLAAGLGAVAAHDLAQRVEVGHERGALQIAVERELPVRHDEPIGRRLAVL